MTIEILGSGGAVAVPRAFCDCAVCTEARERPEPPYVRHSPSLYVHDLELLIDTPEEIRIQLNRSGIRRVRTALYTHWHPDHTAGVRVFESNYSVASLLDPGRRPRRTRVILPDRVAATFGQYHALAEKLRYLERYGLVRIDEVAVGGPVDLGSSGDQWTVTPVALPEDIAAAYLFEGPRRVFVAMDEIGGFDASDLGPVDLAILPCGFFLANPITGAPIIAADHPVLSNEPSFAETLEIAMQIDAARTVFVHLNHGLGLRPSEFEELATRLHDDPRTARIEFAFDTMRIEV